MKKIISTTNAPSAVGAYSQAIAHGNMLFISGQLPIDPSTGLFAAEDIYGQTIQSMKNLQAILQANGMDMSNIVKTTVLMANIEDFAQMNEAYKSFFNSEFPARSAFAVKDLPKNSLIEIEAIAIKS